MKLRSSRQSTGQLAVAATASNLASVTPLFDAAGPSVGAGPVAAGDQTGTLARALGHVVQEMNTEDLVMISEIMCNEGTLKSKVKV